MRVGNNLGIRFLILMLFLVRSIQLFSQEGPVLNFSDATDGPITGWEQSLEKGMAVSIWGHNFGLEREDAYVTVGGVNLVNDSDYAEWGAVATPKVPVGMQRITFFLNSEMVTGGSFPNTTITVTTSAGTSNAIPFHTRVLGDNHIYFIDNVHGDDSANGLFCTNGSGVDGPVRTTGWAREHLIAGDVVYIRDAGVAYTGDNSHDDDADNYQFCHGGLFTFCDYEVGSGGGSPNHAQGTVGKSIAVIAYPGESPKLEPLSGESAFSVIRTVWEKLEYWTFSKFTVNGLQPLSVLENVTPPYDGHMTHIRFVGHEWTTPGVTVYDYGDGFDFIGGNGSSYIYIYGIFFHDIGTDTVHGAPATTDFRSYAMYFNGYGTMHHVYVGWNELDYTSYGRGFQFYGHHGDDWMDELYIHNNWIHETSRQSLIFSGEGGDDNYAFIKNAYIYNNILERSGTGDVVLQLGGQYGNGRFGGSFYVYNNVFSGANNDGCPAILIGKDIDFLDFRNNIILGVPNAYGYFSYFPDDAPTENITAGNNLYFGAGVGAKPAWDTSALENNNPMFINPTPIIWSDFRLMETSPARDAGDSSIDLASRDFSGKLRGSVYDIGAFDWETATVDAERVLLENDGVIFPNPTTGEVSLSKGFVNTECFIYDMTGRMVKEIAVETDVLDLSSLESGIYIVVIIDNEDARRYRYKLIKQ